MADLIRFKQLMDTGWVEKKGVQLPTRIQPGDLSLQLQNQPQFGLSYNEMTHSPEIHKQPISEQEFSVLHIALNEHGYVVAGGAQQAQAAFLHAAYKKPYNPVQEYLNHVESNKSLEPVDINKIATNYLGANDPLADSMLAATLIGAVKRAFEPGCKFDTCTVLKGDQGIRKSTFWQALAGPHWFCDTPQEKNKDFYLVLNTCWFYELAELENKTRKVEAGEIKALLSSSIDTFRLPYGKVTGQHPRQGIIVASVNTEDFLKDPTGARRFWIIELPQTFRLGEYINTDQVVTDRDRIWKAAVVAYREGRKPILSLKEQNESETRNLNYEEEHPFLDALAHWCRYGFASDGFSTSDALIQSDLREKGRITSYDQKQAAVCLRQLGYEQDKHQESKDGKKLPRKWRKASPVSAKSKPSEAPHSPAGATKVKIASQNSEQNNERIENTNHRIELTHPRCESEKSSEASEAQTTFSYRGQRKVKDKSPKLKWEDYLM